MKCKCDNMVDIGNADKKVKCGTFIPGPDGQSTEVLCSEECYNDNLFHAESPWPWVSNEDWAKRSPEQQHEDYDLGEQVQAAERAAGWSTNP